MERNLEWLNSRVEAIWSRYFHDIPQSTPVRVRWGQRSYRRLGSIILKQRADGSYYSLITISSLLREPEVICGAKGARSIKNFCQSDCETCLLFTSVLSRPINEAMAVLNLNSLISWLTLAIELASCKLTA